jgi:hypothetical protein
MEIAKLVLEYLKAIAWPGVVLTALAIFRHELSALIATLEHLKLPGGAELDWKRQVREAEQAAEKVEASPRAARTPTEPQQAQLISKFQHYGFTASPSDFDWNYYLQLADTDPNLALAGLRMEIERMLQNMAKVAGIDYDRFRTSPGRFSALLKTREVIEPDEYELLRSVINVANAALHGRDVTAADARRTIESAEAFKDSYLAFMSGAISRIEIERSGG